MRISLSFLLAVLLSVCTSVAQSTQQPDQRFKQWDKNADEKLSRDELPEQIRANFDRVDADKNGSISLSEHSAFLNRAKQSGRTKNQQRPRKKAEVPAGTIVHKDLVYVDGGHERHKLDLYLPAKASSERPVPLVIWIHGGGWRKGSKDRFAHLNPLLEKGFAVASVNYRLSSHAVFPAQIHDCKSAVRYLRKHADKHGIAPNKFGAWGSSAGGHLVALLGTSGGVAELEGDLGVTGVSSRVQAVCDWFGPTDLLLMNKQAGDRGTIDHDAADSPESKLIGGAIQEHKDKTAKANPNSYVTSDDPPFLIMHGDQDRLVPYQQSQMLNKLLVSAKVDSELIIVPGAGHGLREAKNSDRQRPIEFFASQFLK